jgi:S-adenosylmethionine uptake transporter
MPAASTALKAQSIALIAIALYVVMDALMKSVSLSIGAYSACLWRAMTGLALMLCVQACQKSPRSFRRMSAKTLRLHLLRGTVACFCSLTFFYGIARIPLAEGIAITFIAPLLALYLARVFLKEQVAPMTFLGALVGLLGVCIVLLGRLGNSAWGQSTCYGMIALILSALLYAANLVLQRVQALESSPHEIVFFYSLVVSHWFVSGAYYFGHVPPPHLWLATGLSGVLSVAVTFLLAWAYSRAQTQQLVTLEYTAFIWSALLGYIFFHEELSWQTLIGTLLIISGCGIATKASQHNLVTLNG